MKRVVIIGGGIAGISAAVRLEKRGIHPTLIEKTDHLGGRVHTEKLHGYLLDEGFQVLLSSYPEIASIKQSLDLGCYAKGAHVKLENGWKMVANPFCDPLSILKWPKGTSRSVIALLWKLVQNPGEVTTAEWIDQLPAAKSWKEGFLKPFMRGVLLDPALSAPAGRFKELMGYFISGCACLPKKGMGEIPNILASSLKETHVMLRTEAARVSPRNIVLRSGNTLEADAVILALPISQMHHLLPDIPKPSTLATTCDYFALSRQIPQADTYLWLDGGENSPINNFSFPSVVQPSYGPPGRPLLSASALGPDQPSIKEVQEYLRRELDLKEKEITHLKRYLIDQALPVQAEAPPVSDIYYEGFYLAGEAVSPPSINDAIASGKRAANRLLEDLS